MYKVDPIVTYKEEDFVHTERMYKLEPIFPRKVVVSSAKHENSLDKFIPKNSAAQSRLGQALEAMKSGKIDEATIHPQPEQQVHFESASQVESANEMLLDKYIVRKTAPVSKLGKHLHNASKKEDVDSTLLHRLHELERMIDAYLAPMPFDKSTITIPSTKSLASAAEKPPKPAHIDNKSQNQAIFTPATTLSPQSGPDFVDLAVHCDPSCPPFALLAYSQMLLFSGRGVSVQFYRHSTLTSIPEYLIPLEHFFTGKPRSSTSDFIISIIWRPCSFGCMAIGNPFKDLPLYGESIILMFLARLSPDFDKTFRNLSLVESALSCNDSKALVDCVNKIAKKGEERLSIDEIYLFLSSAKSRLSSVIQKSSKSWFDRCMLNDSLASTLKVIDLCH
ncbi:unnamed protein product [Rodentolepis nana]|uniref:Thioredoxin_16 domain-containing protein n=1 Tax=Rodentolepis nana TaxID=102285 RepID=A0A0R3T463_RODNA|nr:unnamed protein product [Rodentolepis nana]